MQYEFNNQRLDSGSKPWSSGGNEKPRDLQVEQYTKVTVTTSQEEFQIIFSGQEALCSIFFCYF